MAFGDGNNDIELLQAVGRGIAMENASAELKAVATDTCGHVAQDGICHYLLDIGLI
jgi:hydroxymethylpyrimidine pyrophosphatase-like HAD family hydrolase